MFAYCENDPVNKSDPTGEVAPVLIAMAGGAALGILEQLMTDMIYAMVTGQPLDECFSSAGTYAASAFGGALSVFPGGGAMRVASEIILTSMIQTSIDAALTPEVYKESSPYQESFENAITTSGSVAGEKYAPDVSSKLSKATKGKGKLISSLTKSAGKIINSMGKYFGNAIEIAFRIFKGD